MWAGGAGWWMGALAAAAVLAALAACRRRKRPLAPAALAPPRILVLRPAGRWPDTRSPSLERDGMEGEPGLRRFRSVSARLDRCGAERLDPADALGEPRFYTPPEAASPRFFAEPSPKSVYYDSVRSPRFFPDTPRETEPPRSPLALAEHANRNDEPGSPRPPGARSSPRAPSRDKENRFAFEPDGGRPAPRPRKYGGRGSLERERAPADPRRYRRHNSADAGRDAADGCAPAPAPAPPERDDSAQARRQRLKSISLDSDNAKMIERNLGLPIAKRLKERMNEAFKNDSSSCESVERSPPAEAAAFVDMPRFSPKEFEVTVTAAEGPAPPEAPAPDEAPRRGRNPRNLTIDLSKRDSQLERELLAFDALFDKKVRTPTLKVKATSLDSSEPAGLSLPRRRDSRDSASVPNTPKRQPKRILAKPEARRPPKGQDSGIYLREQHASLMLYQPGEAGAGLGAGLLGYKQSLSVSSTNLKTLPEGVPSDDFEPSAEDDKLAKKLHRRNSNQSLLPDGPAPVRASASNFSLPAPGDGRNCLLQRRGSNNSLTLNLQPGLSRHSSNGSLHRPAPRKGLLERRSSNTSLTLTIDGSDPVLAGGALSVSHCDLNGASVSHCDLNGASVSHCDLNGASVSHCDLNGALEPAARKALSTESLTPRARPGFGSHDDLRGRRAACAGAAGDELPPAGRSITTKPLSPQTTSEDFRLYLANMQHLQNASSVLSRRRLRDLNDVFQNGYSKVRCGAGGGRACCAGADNPQTVIPEAPAPPCSEYQKMLLRNLHQEFWDMPTNFQEKPIVSGSHHKNRYKTILPNEHSRVMLRADAGCAEGYINANYVKGHEYTRNSYIATQGPLQNTMYDFWLMVHQNCLEHAPPALQKVVMLTNFIENNRQKCEKYFPLELHEEVDIASAEGVGGRFRVRNDGMLRKPGYTVRKLRLRHLPGEPAVGDRERNDSKCENESGESKSDSDSDRPAAADSDSDSDAKSPAPVTVYHYWFHNWADHKCPKDVNALLNLSLDVLRPSPPDMAAGAGAAAAPCECSASPKPESRFLFPPLEAPPPCAVQVSVRSPLELGAEPGCPPTVVHCSAGIGRTGCLIAILNGIRQLSAEHKVDVLGIVCNMRLNRGGMVQNSEQYELIHKVLCLFEQACLPSL